MSTKFVPPLICWDIIRDGTLCLQKPDSVIEISEVWPRPVARASTWQQPEWHTCRPKIQLGTQTSPQVEFFSAVPSHIRTTLSQFPAFQWELLCGVAASPAVLELLQVNPALGLMSQVYWEFVETSERSPRYALTLAKRRQRDIAGVLGFPETNWSVRALAKFPVERLRVRELLSIRRLMNDPQNIKGLQHIERLDSQLLCFFQYPNLRDIVSWRLIDDLARNHDEQTSGKIVMQLIELDEDHRRRQRPLRRQFETVDQIAEAWHAFQAARRPRRPFDKRQPVPFPRAPLPRENGIAPLLSSEEIIEEGRKQHNCVAGYINAARRGQIYLFKVTYPERATLSVKRKAGRWQYSELKGPHNCPVGRATRAYVSDWLAFANARCPHQTVSNY